jgi:hypothetical protein
LEFAVAVHQIWRRRRWLAPVALVSVFAALNIAYHVSLVPPRLESRSVERGVASTHLLVDSARSALPDLAIEVESLAGRAQVYAELLRSESVQRRVGKEAGVPWKSLFVDGSTTDPNVGRPEPSSEERGVELQGDDKDARIFFRVDPSQPIIYITTQGEDSQQAVALAQAAALSLSEYIDQSQEQDGVPGPRRVEVTQLGDAVGGTANESAATTTAIVVGIALFGVGCLLILLIPRFAESLRTAQALEAGRPRRRRWQRSPLREGVDGAVKRISARLKRLRPDSPDGDGEQEGVARPARINSWLRWSGNHDDRVGPDRQPVVGGNGDLEERERAERAPPEREPEDEAPERDSAEESSLDGESVKRKPRARKPATRKSTRRRSPQRVSAGGQRDSRDD